MRRTGLWRAVGPGAPQRAARLAVMSDLGMREKQSGYPSGKATLTLLGMCASPPPPLDLVNSGKVLRDPRLSLWGQFLCVSHRATSTSTARRPK